MNRTAFFTAASLAAIALAGCGPEAPVRGAVKGRVSVAGKPLAEGVITFENTAAGVSRMAAVGEGGQYEVKAHDGPGLPPGSYKVAVSNGRMPQPDEVIGMATDRPKAQPKPAVTVPAKYTKVATSGLTAEVKAGENPPFDFDLTP